jgi:hypothetical protein
MLGRRIDREARPDLMASHRGDIDDMSGFLLLIYGSAAAMLYSTP